MDSFRIRPKVIVSSVGAVMLSLCVTSSSFGTSSSPLSLSDVVSIALTDNPAMLNACDAIHGARYGIDIAEAEFGFRFTPQAASGLGADTETSQSTSFNLSKKFSTGTSIELSSGTSASDRHFYRSFAGVTVSQSLLRGFGRLPNTANIVDAERRVMAAEMQARITREQVAIDTIAAFYRIVGQKLLVGVWTRSLERAQQLLSAAEAKMERGLATKIDIFRSQSQVAVAEGSLFDVQETLQETKDALKILLNRDLIEDIDVESQIVSSVAVQVPDDQLIEQAGQNRLDLREAANQVEDAERAVTIASRNLFPDLRVGLNYSLSGRGQSLSDSLGFDNSRFRVLFSTSIPLNFVAERAQYQQKQLDLKRKKRELEEMRKKIVQQVRQALRHVATVQKRIEIQEKNLQSTQASLDLARFRFERGYADLVEVLRAEDSLTQAQREEIALRIDKILSTLRLRQAAGVLSPFLETLQTESSLQNVCTPPGQPTPVSE